MIHMETGGGLGNQLFGFAMARALQLETGESITVYDYHRGTLLHSKRTFECMISPEADVRFVEKEHEQGVFYWKISPCSSLLFSLSNRVFRKLFSVQNSMETYAMECRLQAFWNRIGFGAATLGYIPLKRHKKPKNYILHGYFLSPRFWGKHTETIRTEFYHPELISEKNQKLMQEIQSCNSVAVHIRLGDYVTDEATRKVFYVCDENYYRRAFEAVCDELQDPVLIVFTNDIKGASAYPFPQGVKTVFVPEGNSAVEDLQLMAQCKHFVISNSTYSWWGQFLGQNPSKRVYAPETWFREEKPMDLAMPFWVKLPVDIT